MRGWIVAVMVALVVGLAAALFLWSRAGAPAAAGEEYARLANRGQAHLGNREADKAIEFFRRAAELSPRIASAHRNLARAQLLAGKAQAALLSLNEARSRDDAESASTAYLTGIAYLRLTDFTKALPHLERAAALDSVTAAIHFQLAGIYDSLGDSDRAVAALRETVKLDPLHASAHYKLGTFARKRGDVEEFKACHREFMRLREAFGNESRSSEALETCVHTMAEPAADAVDRSKPIIPLRFANRTESAVPPDIRAIGAIAVIEAPHGRGYELVAFDGDGGLALITWKPGGRFVWRPVDATLPDGFKATACRVADFFDDVPADQAYDPAVHRKNDVLLLSDDSIVLLKRTDDRRFDDVTETSGLAGASARAARWIDFDHDGDVDLFLGGEQGLQVWQNNGDGTFLPVQDQIGATLSAPVVGIVAADLDANGAVDVVVAVDSAAPVLLENQRMGRFARNDASAAGWGGATTIRADDLRGDAGMDLLLAQGGSMAIGWPRGGGATLPEPVGVAWEKVELIDFDNDGRLDIVALGTESGRPDRGAVGVLRNAGADMWRDVGVALGLNELDLPPLRDAIPADFDSDGDSDLLLVARDGGLHYLSNEGGNANGQLKVTLLPVKTNPSGMGAELEVREGLFRVTRRVHRPFIEIGIGARDRVDTLQTLWTNGVVDNLIDVTIEQSPLRIEEKVVATGSCPFVYVWDGRRYRFGTDILGNSPVGLSLARGVYLPADPDEYVYLGNEKNVRPRDGRFLVQVTEEFREVLYLDQVRLVAVDHPPGTEVHATDKLMPEPFPPSRLRTLEAAMTPTRAMGDDGIDRTAALQAMDGQFADSGIRRPPPFRGQVTPTPLTLEFEAIYSGVPLVLVLTGWLQYGDASTNIALSQAGPNAVVPPRLEVQTDDSMWHPVDVVVGMPAGKTKTILVDLENKLPDGSKALRLTSSFEIYWDRIALMEGLAAPRIRRHSLAPKGADLKWRGFSDLRTRGSLHPTTPDFNDVSERPPWRGTPQGWCTRYGDVVELIADRDERVAILNAGDAVEISFAANALPPIPNGFVRSFFFYSVGWDKDGDHNVASGDRVEPLPISRDYPVPTSMDDSVDHWETRYNTRWVPADVFDRRSE